MSHDAPHPRLRDGTEPTAPPVGPRARLEEPGTTPGMWDRKGNVDGLLRILYGVAALLVLLDLVVHRHAEHPWEGLFSFYPLYGFVGIVLLVGLARVLRALVMRPEDHYGD
ncbi:MAG TPA: hypothetical protein VK849_10180 [Longimicrobiales bacterium]|nr:hypothetical protein [Longimicrobiales bacterium]